MKKTFELIFIFPFVLISVLMLFVSCTDAEWNWNKSDEVSDELTDVSDMTTDMVDATEKTEYENKKSEEADILTPNLTTLAETTEAETKEPITIIENEDLIQEDVNVPVLMYHTSSEENPGGLTELYVKPSEFELQITTLIELGYTFCTFDDFDNIKSIQKPIMITFDDGYLENYTEIFPILKKHNAKITLFLILNSVTPSNLTEEMIKEMSDSELVKFESHTLTHPSLVKTSENATLLDNEIRLSKERIEEITGKEVLALSYPNGEFNDAVKTCTAKYYKYGLRKDLGMHNTEYDNYEVRRIRINRSTGINSYLSLIGEK